MTTSSFTVETETAYFVSVLEVNLITTTKLPENITQANVCFFNPRLVILRGKAAVSDEIKSAHKCKLTHTCYEHSLKHSCLPWQVLWQNDRWCVRCFKNTRTFKELIKRLFENRHHYILWIYCKLKDTFSYFAFFFFSE